MSPEIFLAYLVACVLIAIAYLSEIEAGKRRGSVDTLGALARALRVDFDDLVAWRRD